jgi:integrase
MQKGYIYKQHGSWVLQYYDIVLESGIRVRKKSFHTLARVGPEYPNKSSVLLLAQKHLALINSGQLTPESSMRVTDFIEDIYLPHIKETLRPSTYKNYKTDEYERHIKSRLGDIRLRDFRTVTGQRIMVAIAKDTGIGHKTLLRNKSFLSGVFKHAKREGLIDFENPMRDVSVPGRPKNFKGAVYTIADIYKIGENLTGVAFVAVMTAAFTGLRLAELRGLQWRDFDGESLHISRTVWRTRIGETKTEGSEAAVPVLPMLQNILKRYKEKIGAKQEDWIFRGDRRGTSLNLPNLVRRQIVPMLTRCSVCHEMQSKHADKDHDFKLDESIPKWQGWHTFRRSLASNLYELGVKPKVIQAILRHSDIGTTLTYYVETQDTESRKALEMIEELFQDEEQPEVELRNSRGEIVPLSDLFKPK